MSCDECQKSGKTLYDKTLVRRARRLSGIGLP